MGKEPAGNCPSVKWAIHEEAQPSCCVSADSRRERRRVVLPRQKRPQSSNWSDEFWINDAVRSTYDMDWNTDQLLSHRCRLAESSSDLDGAPGFVLDVCNNLAGCGVDDDNLCIGEMTARLYHI